MLNDKKIAIVGAGPSGLTCAAELAKAGCQVSIFEKQDKPGGMLRYALPEHRVSQQFVTREIEDILSLGIELHCKPSIDSQQQLDQLLEDGYHALYLATGAWTC